MPSLKAIHIAKSLEEANRTSQNLSIIMSLPTLTKRKYDRTTKCINHWSIGYYMKLRTVIKFTAN